MLQFRGKGYGVFAGDSVKILAKIVREIHCDLLSFFGVEPAKAVNAHQGVIDEMRSHLQHHNAGSLVGDFQLLPDDFLLLAAILLDLIGQNETIHSKCGENIANVNERKNVCQLPPLTLTSFAKKWGLVTIR